MAATKTPPRPQTHAHTPAPQPQAARGQTAPRLVDRRCASEAASGDRTNHESRKFMLCKKSFAVNQVSKET